MPKILVGWSSTKRYPGCDRRSDLNVSQAIRITTQPDVLKYGDAMLVMEVFYKITVLSGKRAKINMLSLVVCFRHSFAVLLRP
jgi:hypothetical protein